MSFDDHEFGWSGGVVWRPTNTIPSVETGGERKGEVYVKGGLKFSDSPPPSAETDRGGPERKDNREVRGTGPGSDHRPRRGRTRSLAVLEETDRDPSAPTENGM